jgi:hypothetical protein
VIEIVNEIFFFLLVSVLFYFNEKDKWDEDVKWAFLASIIGNNLINTFISIVVFWVAVRVKLRKCIPSRRVFLEVKRENNNTAEEAKLNDSVHV